MKRLFKLGAMFDSIAGDFSSFDAYADNIRIAKDMGYEAIELSLFYPLGYTTDQMNKFVQSIDMPIANFMTGLNAIRDNLWFSSPVKEVRDKAVERICTLIPYAKEMNATFVVGTMQGRGLEPDYQVGKARVLECFKRIAEVAEKYNQTIVLEPMNFLECGYNFTLAEMMETIKAVGSSCYKPMLDTVHMNIEEADMISPFLRAGKDLGHVHLCETNFAMPGTGKMDYKLTFDALNAIGYDKYVTVKIAREPWPDGSRRSLEYLRSLGLV